MDFAANLKKAIEERGVNQKWLADTAMTTEATISRYINGVNKSPDADILISIAKALNVSVDYLLGVSDVPNYRDDISPEERLLLKAFGRASDRDTSIIWQILEGYLSSAERDYLQQLNQDGSESKIS